MSTKTIVLSAIICALFIGSGVILYNGFSGDPSAIVSSDPDIASAQKNIVNILPYGENLDFGKVKKRVDADGVFAIPYETVNPSEVGIRKQELISPSYGAPATSPLTSPGGENPVPIRSSRTGG